MIDDFKSIFNNKYIGCSIVKIGHEPESKKDLLCYKERLKFQSLKNDKRKVEWISGRIAAKNALHSFNGERNSEVKNRDSGQPYFPDYPELCLSISHSNEFAVAIVSSNRVGIDIELVKVRPDSLARFFYTVKEKDKLKKSSSQDKHRLMTEFWTRKEAYAKYLGVGGVIPFNSIETTEDTVCIPEYSDQNIKFISGFIGDYSMSVAMEAS